MSSSFVVFSGGSACNHILNAFHKVSNHQVSYVLGVSDNGGSTVSIKNKKCEKNPTCLFTLERTVKSIAWSKCWGLEIKTFKTNGLVQP
jgi:2-phospho-L-lactate transferase/gluconeogenesis factor (CofD/UPF0052 family)